MILFPFHFISMRLSFPSHTGFTVRVTAHSEVGRTHGSLLISSTPVPLVAYLREEARYPEYHSGSYQSITGFEVGIYIVSRATSGVTGGAAP